ncbi:UNVERIFIED_CONTAM: hypothetical protein FKN15_063930 [Acipenser sinensis]
MGKNCRIQMCKAGRDLPKKTHSCNCCQRCFYQVLTQGELAGGLGGLLNLQEINLTCLRLSGKLRLLLRYSAIPVVFKRPECHFAHVRHLHLKLSCCMGLFVVNACFIYFLQQNLQSGYAMVLSE